jgi:DUF2075 family protein/phage repressor protein C with HTH and peptisase S24 domain
MVIYQESKARFLADVDGNALKNRLVKAFRTKTGSVPSDSYVWADEYSRFAHALGKAKVHDEIDVAIEYHISAAGRFRIDVLLAGNDGQTDNALIIELKAWETADASDVADMVYCPINGGSVRQHPCLQAQKYRGLILHFNEDVKENDIGLHSAAYLFNLHRRNPEPLEDSRYEQIIRDSKLFLADDVAQLRQFLERFVPKKSKKKVIWLIENGRMRPADELIARVSSMLDGNEEFNLIDEQNEAFQNIKHQIFARKHLKDRHVFVVEGGPGTGKSVIAVRLLAEILKSKRMGFFVAPNKAFRDTLVESMAKGNSGYRADGQALIRSSWSFSDITYKTDGDIDVLIVDEAHRLKDQAYQYKGKSMVDDMVRAARNVVFFIDETQRVSWNDSGSIARIAEAAQKFGAKSHETFKLIAQYRCNGSTGYLNWLNDVLQIQQTGNFENWGDGQYEFKVFDRAEDLYSALKSKNSRNKARLIAGYSWEWPKQGRKRGTTAKHVQADGLSLPWNYDGENWATSKDGIEQVGCVHTSQGVEFDWLGVLIGPDLIYADGKIVGDPTKRAKNDKSLNGWRKALEAAGGNQQQREAVLERVQEIMKSTYKVLLSRGRMGCYVWCADTGLREYLKSRLTLASLTKKLEPLLPPISIGQDSEKNSPYEPEILQDPGREKFVSLVPLYSLEAAAGSFGEPDSADCLGWVKAPSGTKINQRHFVAKVVGRSMEPKIRDGAYCLFTFGVIGFRSGRTVLAQHRSISDPETGGTYTVKKYQSEKIAVEDIGWKHTRIQLLPINPNFRPIEIVAEEEDEIKIIAEFVKVLEP